MTKKSSALSSPDPKRSSRGRKKSSTNDLVDQYLIIRDDLLKLRADLEKGYDMARRKVEKRSFFGRLLRSRL